MLIQNGTIVTAQSVMVSDLRVEGETIAAVAPKLDPLPGEEIVDASGLLVLPGGIDAHTHFDMPAGDDLKTCDDFTSGSRAALFGGTTSILDFAEPDLDAPLSQGLAVWHEKSDGKTFCDYGYHMTVSHWDETMDAQIADMAACGVSSFKAYTAYKDGIGVEDADLFRILCGIRKAGGLLMVHAENGDLINVLTEKYSREDPAKIINHAKSRPNLVEKEAVSRVIDLAALAETPVYIVHISTKEALDAVVLAKQHGQEVYAESCPHYLLMNDTVYEADGLEAAKYIMSPPLRKQADEDRLWEGLLKHEVDLISTDHCAFNLAQKATGEKDFTKIPNGIPGVEHRLELMYHFGEKHGLDLKELAALTAEHAAKIFGLYPRKGILAVGSDADIVLMDPNCPHTISADSQMQDIDYTPFEGVTVDKKVTAVYLRGTQLVKDGRFIGDRPQGKFLFCNPIGKD